ncbi:conserved Plasmodium protein, unknown function [Plasmodium berghei]|uniref:Uncharacterized protein n=2 Tax=Plasmodium berghei TaxID=5821 RepID=A0A509AI55_PLABA|nr:conserved Plasmodium protein, unknown function [Plasmodium berghei ANKA]SCL92666.1 conserved Plasmodium protein, unknown function [Plasmodium berghei]SCM15690.1 conserved Plasmodium protein, unknown function [Plasmodium berghei]SCM17484.1 conserved Plasmodium protein, unknown function [Plasmodium berghei]SCN22866.1 conserved Plasmodium protein, unknown function [Plasmodium berghei]VUC54466.1 conserved Plasmodium protein, unknown function [Plasmodium berghei ANKA]|eukprot:XP_034420295.1 conserved Plasmodium protein, unknown function [Plasmodium berghei ANKA]
MSLNFSDDDIYENKGEEIPYENNLNEDIGNNEVNFNEENYGDEYADELEKNEQNEKKKKKTITFQLKNIFNEAALKQINNDINKKRKSEKRNSYNDDNSNMMGQDEFEEKYSDDDDGELKKYVQDEKNKIKQLVDEKDELWDIYIYLNLKKKKRKIDYTEERYTNAIKKVLDSFCSEYKNLIIENLFKNKKFEKCLIVPDIDIFFKNNNLENVHKNTTIPVINKKNSLLDIKKKLVNIYNKGNCFNYLKEVSVDNMSRLNGSEEDEYGFDNNESTNDDKNEYMFNDNNKIGEMDTNFIIEREKLNLKISRLEHKYIKLIQTVKQYKRKHLRTNFNLFMNLINEVTSKLYFSIHNVLLINDGANNLADIYKTIRRKYNIHDVLNKIQNLTQKKEVYEHYRSYLIYKYKSTYPICNSTFKNHKMEENINIFNFKKVYNTKFINNFSLIQDENDLGHEYFNKTENSMSENKINVDANNNMNKNKKHSEENIFYQDVYEEDFFNIDTQNKESDNIADKTNDIKTDNWEACDKNNEINHNANRFISDKQDAQNKPDNTDVPTIIEETPLERAKRIAREKKKKLMENKAKII